MTVESMSDWRAAHPAADPTEAYLALQLMTAHALFMCALMRGYLRLMRAWAGL